MRPGSRLAHRVSRLVLAGVCALALDACHHDVLAPLPPSLVSLTPGGGVAGTTVSVTLTGTNFAVGTTTVAVSSTGVTVSAVTVTSSTSLTASFAIAAGTAPGSYTVTVTTSAGTSATQPFTIAPPPPTLTALAPAAGVQGTTVGVTFTGTNFITGATTV